MATARPIAERFWPKVDLSAGMTACWPWTASLQNRGYGQFNNGKTMVKAHRVAFELTRGPIPAGLELDHLCRNRRCVNPLHLDPVTAAENARRGLSGSRQAADVCKRGHQFTVENTYWRAGSHGPNRQCRTCIEIRWRRAS